MLGDADLLDRWFNIFYDGNVVSEEIFMEWEKDNDVSKSAEYPGKVSENSYSLTFRMLTV